MFPHHLLTEKWRRRGRCSSGPKGLRLERLVRLPTCTPSSMPPPSARFPALSHPHFCHSCSPRKHGHKTDICFNFHLKGQFSTGCLQAVGVLYEALSCFPKILPASGFPGSKFIHNYLGGKGFERAWEIVESGEYIFFQSDQE